MYYSNVFKYYKAYLLNHELFQQSRQLDQTMGRGARVFQENPQTGYEGQEGRAQLGVGPTQGDQDIQ